MTTNGVQDLGRNFTALASYQNNRHRFSWGLTAGQIPYVSGGVAEAQGIGANGSPVILQQVITTWEQDRPVTAYLAYPFNQAQRLEFSGGYENVSYAARADTHVFDPFGNLLLKESQDIPTLGDLNQAIGTAALIYDTSLFGGVSPVAGQRYRFQAGIQGGTLAYSNLLADYRRYLHLARSFSLAGRALHYGRYGGDAENQRLQPLYIGYPEFIHGYNVNSISANECGGALNQTGACPVCLSGTG